MLAQGPPALGGKAIDGGIDGRGIEGLAEVDHDVPAHGERHPGLGAIVLRDRRDHQGRAVEDDRQRGQPRLVVVLRAVEAQDRKREVALEHFGRPSLPLGEELIEPLQVAEAGQAAQQRGGRRAASRRERRAARS